MEDFKNLQIDNYLIEDELGRGGMAIVYRARHVQLDRVCALKILRPELADDERFVERFLREARRSAQLEHPHIVPIYDTGSDGRNYFIAMKYLPGYTLRQIMDRGPVEPQQIASYLTQAADALDYAHGRNIVHRDIKPGNMVIDNSGWLTLTDFGLARATDDLQLTMTGTLVGTPVYMAPEQVQGRPATARTDQYQLGIVAYELLAGGPPFSNRAPYAVLQAQVSEQPTPLHEVAPQLAPEISLVVDKALAKQPEERYSSTGEFVSQLTPFLAGRDFQPPVVAGPGVIDETDRLYRGAVAADATTSPATLFPEETPPPAPVTSEPTMFVEDAASGVVAAATAASISQAGQPGAGGPAGAGGPPPPVVPVASGDAARPGRSPVLFIVLGAVALVLLCGLFGGGVVLYRVIGGDDDDPTATPEIARATNTPAPGTATSTSAEGTATIGNPTATTAEGNPTATNTRPPVVTSVPRTIVPTNTLPPEQPTATLAPVPQAGDVLAELDPAQVWAEGQQNEDVSNTVRDGVFYVQMTASTVFLYYDSTTSYGDASTAVDVRLTDPTALSAACVVARFVLEPQANYELCLAGDGEATARYWDGATSEYITLLEWAAYPGALAPTESNRLEIRARGNDLWFLINDTVIGQVNYAGTSEGYLGVQVISFEDGPAEWAFDNLVVRSLQ